MARDFRYQSRSDDDMRQRAETGGGDFEGYIKSEFRLYRPRNGDNWIRFLPPTWDNARHYGIEVWVHYGVGADDAAVVCLNKMKKEPCPVCEAREIADRKGDTDLADDLKPRHRVLVWLLDRKESERDQRPYAWAMGSRTDNDFCKAAISRNTGVPLRVDHHLDGYNVAFDKEGDRDRTRYTRIQYDNQMTEVPETALDYIMDHPLPDILRWRTYEEVYALFEGRRYHSDSGDRSSSRGERDRGSSRGDDRGRDDRNSRDDRGGDSRGGDDRNRNSNDRNSDDRNSRDDRGQEGGDGRSTSDKLRERWSNERNNTDRGSSGASGAGEARQRRRD